MHVSQNCIDLIKKFEGFSAKPYLCPAGVPTIGFGSTFYEDGTRVSMADNPIGEDYAESLLRNVVKSIFETGVNTMLTVTPTQNQFDALVSFAYNLGLQALRGSTLLRRFNAGNPQTAACEFSKWDHSGGKVLAGLTARRSAECQLFLS